jgi:hypothetical protein
LLEPNYHDVGDAVLAVKVASQESKHDRLVPELEFGGVKSDRWV